MNAPLFESSCRSHNDHAPASGCFNPLKMRIVGILLFSVLVAAAQAQQPQGRLLPADGELLLRLPYSMRLELESPAGVPSSVFTSDYWSRVHEERARLASRDGKLLVQPPKFRRHQLQQTAVAGYAVFNFV